MKEEHLKWLQRNSLCVPIKGLPVIGPYRVVLSHIKSGKPWQTCPIKISRQAFARILGEMYEY